MKAENIMSVKVVTVREETPITDAARLLVKLQISGLPVVDPQGSIQGIITERDVLLQHELIRCVGDIMTIDVITVEESTSLEELAQILLQHNIKRVPVLRGGRLVGIVSRTDVIRGQLAAEAARVGDKPPLPHRGRVGAPRSD